MSAVATIPNPPKFQGPNGPGPTSAADWNQFIRWLLQVFQGLQNNVANVADVTSMLAAMYARPSDSDGVDYTADIADVQGKLSILFARPDSSADVDLQPAIDTLNSEFALLYARPDNDTDTSTPAQIDALNGQISLLLANSSNDDVTLPPVGPGAGTYTTGLKLTGGGNNGSITIDAQGRITAIIPAT